MTTAYLIQTYHLPAQALRLASTIRAGSPDSVIIISHDRDAATGVDPGMGDVADSVLHGPGGRGDFGTVDRYLDCLAWIARETDGVDWVINITGQDYPIRPLAEVEAELASTSTDGFLEFFAAMDPFCRWGRREARDRYLYRYRWLRGQLSLESRRAIRPLLIINRVQPYVRLTVSYGLAIGRRSRVVPFGRDLPCYGGAFYGALSWKAVSVVRERPASDPALEAHFRRTLVPEEAILQTLVVGARGLAIQNDSRRYYDFRGSVAGSPRVLTTDDLERVLESDAWFARKFDERVDAEVLDRLDEVVTAVPGSSGIAGT